MPVVIFKISGNQEVQRALAAIGPELRDIAIPRALAVAAERVVARARANLRPGHGLQTGILQTSLGAFVRRSRGSGRPSYAVIGARHGIVGRDGRVPANYAHLVESGHRVVIPVKGTSIRRKTAGIIRGGQIVGARPFLAPALAAAGYDVQRAFTDELYLFHQRHGKPAAA